MSEAYLGKENMEPFSQTKTDEMSMYESNSPFPYTENSEDDSHSIIGPPLEDHDAKSQDYGFGANRSGDDGKSLSLAWRNKSTMSFRSMCSIKEKRLDLFDVESLQKPQIPHGFNQLISNPLAPSVGYQARCSSEDTTMKLIFFRSLSLQHANVGPHNSSVHASLFKGGEPKIRSYRRPSSEAEIGIVAKSIIFEEEEEESSVSPVKLKLHQCFSATEESNMCVVQQSSTKHDLIGDFSKKYSLPLTRGRHQDLKAITPATLAQLMKGDFTDSVSSFKIIDCRYPYEFEGGHIDGAINIYTNEQCLDLLHAKEGPLQTSQERHILIFHCEFSSKRGPGLYRYLRKEDRQKNVTNYPFLHFPEIYLLEGGYKNFFKKFQAMCTPVAYKEMLHPEHEKDLKYFRQKCKTWNCDSRQQRQRSRFGRRRLK